MQGSNPIFSNDERSKTVILVFRIYMVLLAFSIVSECVAYANFRNQEYITSSTRMLMLVVALVGFVRAIGYIFLAVFFIMWMRRAYHNVHKAGSRLLRHSEGWAAGAWFVPFLNLSWPLQIMRDIWIETQNVFRRQDQPFEREEDNITGWWWAMFLVSGIVSEIGAFAINSQNFEMGYAFAAMADLGYVFAAVLAITMIQRISRMETEMKNVPIFTTHG